MFDDTLQLLFLALVNAFGIKQSFTASFNIFSPYV